MRKKGNKLHAQKSQSFGREFDSGAEADRYGELLLQQQAGEISNLECQVPYELIPAQYEIVPRYGKNGKRLKDGKKCIEKSVVYYADFQYINKDGEKIVEDVKGFRKGCTYALFTIKRKLMLQVHGIKVQEITKKTKCKTTKGQHT